MPKKIRCMHCHEEIIGTQHASMLYQAPEGFLCEACHKLEYEEEEKKGSNYVPELSQKYKIQ